MQKKRTRRKFTKEFKTEAVRLVLEQQRPVSEVAKDLGIWESSLFTWVEQAKTDRGQGKAGALTTEERGELAQLRREVRTLRMEREILKKAAASSTGGRNSSDNLFSRREIAERFAWTSI